MPLMRFNNYDEYDAFNRIRNAGIRRKRGMEKLAAVEKFMGKAQRLSQMQGIPKKQLFTTMIENNPDIKNRLQGYVASEGYEPSGNIRELCAQVAHTHNEKISDIQDMYDPDSFEPDNLFGLGKKNKAKRQAKKAARKAKRSKKKADRKARREKRKAERQKKKAARKSRRAQKKAARQGRKHKGGEDASDLVDSAEAVEDQQEAQEDAIIPEGEEAPQDETGGEEGGEESGEDSGEEAPEESEEEAPEEDTPIEEEVEENYDPENYMDLAGADHYTAEAELFGGMEEGDSYTGETEDISCFIAAASFVGADEIHGMRNSDQLDIGKIGKLFKKKPGGTKVGNLIRSIGKKTTVNDIINAATKPNGLSNTVNKVVKKVENQKKKEWAKDNAIWIILGLLVFGGIIYKVAKKD